MEQAWDIVTQHQLQQFTARKAAEMEQKQNGGLAGLGGFAAPGSGGPSAQQEDGGPAAAAAVPVPASTLPGKQAHATSGSRAAAGDKWEASNLERSEAEAGHRRCELERAALASEAAEARSAFDAAVERLAACRNELACGLASAAARQLVHFEELCLLKVGGREGEWLLDQA
jgi:hypothetical protein